MIINGFGICYMGWGATHAGERGEEVQANFRLSFVCKSAKRLIADAWQFNYNERARPLKGKFKGRKQRLWGSIDAGAEVGGGRGGARAQGGKSASEFSFILCLSNPSDNLKVQTD